MIPTGDASGLLPITGLLFGATISTLLLTLTRNLYILRIRNIAELHVQNAVMARTFLLSPTFFSKNPSGELSEKLNNVTTLAGLINEAAVGALLNAILNIIYLTQVYIYGGKLFWPAVAVIFIQYAVLLLNYRRAVNVREKYTGRAAKLSGLEYNLFAGIQKLKLTGSENRAFARWLDHYSEPPPFHLQSGIQEPPLPCPRRAGRHRRHHVDFPEHPCQRGLHVRLYRFQRRVRHDHRRYRATAFVGAQSGANQAHAGKREAHFGSGARDGGESPAGGGSFRRH